MNHLHISHISGDNLPISKPRPYLDYDPAHHRKFSTNQPTSSNSPLAKISKSPRVIKLDDDFDRENKQNDLSDVFVSKLSQQDGNTTVSRHKVSKSVSFQENGEGNCLVSQKLLQNEQS